MRGMLWRRQDGQTTVLMVALLVVAMAGGALAVDVGTAYVFKERCTSVLEAAALAAASYLPNTSAAHVAAQELIQANGLDPDKVTIVSPYDGDSRKVFVGYGDQRPTFFAKTLGIDILPINSRVVAMRGGPAALGYAIFSGSTFEYLDFGGATINVTGNVHANENVRIRGATVSVSGALQAAGIVDVRGSTVTADEIINYAPVLAIPQYSVAELRDTCDTRYSGNQHWMGQTINVDGNVFVDGDLKLSGVTITGQGTLVVTGNIELAGTSMNYSGPSDAVCVYSLGDIRITGTSFNAEGILYAPNGTIDSHGASLTVHGSVIADMVDFSGVNVTVVHDPNAATSFPGVSTRLTR